MSDLLDKKRTLYEWNRCQREGRGFLSLAKPSLNLQSITWDAMWDAVSP